MTREREIERVTDLLMAAFSNTGRLAVREVAVLIVDGRCTTIRAVLDDKGALMASGS